MAVPAQAVIGILNTSGMSDRDIVYRIDSGGNGGLAIDAYQIGWNIGYVGTVPGNTAAQIAINGPSYSVMANVTGLTLGGQYRFFGRAHNSAGWGPWSSGVDYEVPHLANANSISAEATSNVAFTYEFKLETSADRATYSAQAQIGWALAPATAPTNFGSLVNTVYAIVNNVETITASGSLSGVPTKGLIRIWGRSYNTQLSLYGSWSPAYKELQMPGAPDIPDAPTVTMLEQTAITVSNNPNGDGGSNILDVVVGVSLSDAPFSPLYTYPADQMRADGLMPFTTYYIRTTCYNQYGWSGWSNASAQATTTPGVWINVANVWKRAIPWVRSGGVWKRAATMQNVLGTWKYTK